MFYHGVVLLIHFLLVAGFSIILLLLEVAHKLVKGQSSQLHFLVSLCTTKQTLLPTATQFPPPPSPRTACQTPSFMLSSRYDAEPSIFPLACRTFGTLHPLHRGLSAFELS